MLIVDVNPITGKTTVRGPKEFVDNINWDHVQMSAERFASYTDPVNAVKSAIQQQYAAWKGARTL